MSATPETQIDTLATKAMEGLFERVRILEANDYYRPSVFTGAVSRPPTRAELDALLGTPESYNGNALILVRDTTNDKYWLVYGDGSGSEWYHVRMDATRDPIIGARLDHSVNQTITDATDTVLTWDTEIYDIGGFHDGVNPTRLTAPTDGLYHVGANVRWSNNATGERRVQLLHSSSGNAFASQSAHFASGTAVILLDQQVSMDYYALAGEYFEARVYQNSGGNLVLQHPTFHQFSIHLVHQS
jgi:hypothetical protein